LEIMRNDFLKSGLKLHEILKQVQHDIFNYILITVEGRTVILNTYISLTQGSA
jgi:hypothetical protein